MVINVFMYFTKSYSELINIVDLSLNELDIALFPMIYSFDKLHSQSRYLAAAKLALSLLHRLVLFNQVLQSLILALHFLELGLHLVKLHLSG